jgi:hypothetical protein
VAFFILSDQAWTALDKVDAHLPGPVVKLFISFGGCADIHVVNGDIHIWVHLFEQNRILD